MIEQPKDATATSVASSRAAFSAPVPDAAHAHLAAMADESGLQSVAAPAGHEPPTGDAESHSGRGRLVDQASSPTSQDPWARLVTHTVFYNAGAESIRDAATSWRRALARVEVKARSDAGLIDDIDALERLKSACAAAQARLTAAFVTRQTDRAQRLHAEAKACSANGDFDGWVLARDTARSLELLPEPLAPNMRPAAATNGGPDADGQSGHGDGERVDRVEDAGGSRYSRRAREAALSCKTGLSAQIGLARHDSPSVGARHAHTAVALQEVLPHTMRALAAGWISERRAQLVVTGTSHLSPQLRAQVDAEVIGANLPDQTTTPDDPDNPDSVDDPDGLLDLLEGPLTGVGTWGDRRVERRVKACADRLDAQAAAARAAAAAGGRHVSTRPLPDCMAAVRAVLPVEMAVGVHAALEQAAASAKAAGDQRSRGQVMADTLYRRVTGLEEADQTGLEIQIVITDRALLSGEDTPAHIPGHGPVPAAWARDLIRHTAERAGKRALERAAESGTDAASEAARAQQTEATPAPPNRRSPRAGTVPNDPVVDAHDRGDSADEPGATAGLNRELDRHHARLWYRRLYTHPENGTLVAMDSKRRLFPTGLRRFLIARDDTCRTPWCDAPIRHTDHITPHAHGGATSAENGQGLCLRCNLTKDQPGWSSRTTSIQPHTVTITTPTGHQHLSTAPPLLPGLTPKTASPPGRVTNEPVRRLHQRETHRSPLELALEKLIA